MTKNALNTRIDSIHTKLDNGLRLITTPMPGIRSASIAFFFTVGSRYEPEALVGVSHFIEHMLFKGTSLYPSARLISEAIEGVGGNFNGSTGKEITNYTARVPGESFEKVFSVLADMVRQPLFHAKEIEKERSVIIEELSATQDDPQEWVGLLSDETMWPNLPLGRDDAGTIDSVTRLQRAQLLHYLHEHYHPNTLVVSVAGNVDVQEVQDLTEKLFGDWRSAPVPLWTPSHPPIDAPAVRLIQKETEQTNICLATLGASYSSPEYYPLLLINAILGDGMSSRLFQSIREEQGLAYDIGSYTNTYNETGNLVISAGVDPSRTEATIRAILAELRLLSNELVPAEELARIKAYVCGGMLLALEGSQQVASWLGGQESLYNRVRDIDEVIASVNAVTVEEIQRVAQTCFAPQWRRLALIGPDAPTRAAEFTKLLTDA